jgi:DNA-binding CsgD family transcriptional regulator
MQPGNADEIPPKLSERQLDVLRLVAVGASASQIADELSITEATVRTHVKHILARLGANNRAHAVALAIAQGLLGEPAFNENS